MAEKYKFNWMDWTTICTTLILIGVMLGYGWRMHHETKAQKYDTRITAADLSMEIGKKKEFFLYADNDNMLHFVPLRGARYQAAVRIEARP